METSNLWKEHKVTIVTPASGFTGLKRKAKYNRNDLCPCGSGRKIKHCCTRLLDTDYLSINKRAEMSDIERKCKADGVPFEPEFDNINK